MHPSTPFPSLLPASATPVVHALLDLAPAAVVAVVVLAFAAALVIVSLRRRDI